MTLFELHDGLLARPRARAAVSPVQRDRVLAAVRAQTGQVLGRRLVPLTWTTTRHGRFLTALDATGRVVTVGVLEVLDAAGLLEAMVRRCAARTMGRDELAGACPGGEAELRRAWGRIRGPGPGGLAGGHMSVGAGLVILTLRLEEEVLSSAVLMKDLDVEVLIIDIHDFGGADDALVVNVEPLTDRLVEAAGAAGPPDDSGPITSPGSAQEPAEGASGRAGGGPEQSEQVAAPVAAGATGAVTALTPVTPACAVSSDEAGPGAVSAHSADQAPPGSFGAGDFELHSGQRGGDWDGDSADARADETAPEGVSGIVSPAGVVTWVGATGPDPAVAPPGDGDARDAEGRDEPIALLCPAPDERVGVLVAAPDEEVADAPAASAVWSWSPPEAASAGSAGSAASAADAPAEEEPGESAASQDEPILPVGDAGAVSAGSAPIGQEGSDLRHLPPVCDDMAAAASGEDGPSVTAGVPAAPSADESDHSGRLDGPVAPGVPSPAEPVGPEGRPASRASADSPAESMGEDTADSDVAPWPPSLQPGTAGAEDWEAPSGPAGPGGEDTEPEGLPIGAPSSDEPAPFRGGEDEAWGRRWSRAASAQTPALTPRDLPTEPGSWARRLDLPPAPPSAPSPDAMVRSASCGALGGGSSFRPTLVAYAGQAALAERETPGPLTDADLYSTGYGWGGTATSPAPRGPYRDEDPDEDPDDDDDRHEARRSGHRALGRAEGLTVIRQSQEPLPPQEADPIGVAEEFAPSSAPPVLEAVGSAAQAPHETQETGEDWLALPDWLDNPAPGRSSTLAPAPGAEAPGRRAASPEAAGPLADELTSSRTRAQHRSSAPLLAALPVVARGEPSARALRELAERIGRPTPFVWRSLRRRIHHEAVLEVDGAFTLSDGRVFTDPSDAADAAQGTDGTDGWRVWRLGHFGPSLGDLLNESATE